MMDLYGNGLLLGEKNPGQLMDEIEPDYEQHCKC